MTAENKTTTRPDELNAGAAPSPRYRPATKYKIEYLESLREFWEEPDPISDDKPPKITLNGVLENGRVFRAPVSLTTWRSLKAGKFDEPSKTRYPGYGFAVYMDASKKAECVDVYRRDYHDRQTSPYPTPEDEPETLEVIEKSEGSLITEVRPLRCNVRTVRRLLQRMHENPKELAPGTVIAEGYVVDEVNQTSKGRVYRISVPPAD